MAETSVSVDKDQFSCPVCLDLLTDPSTVPCGHSFCRVCIDGCWDQEDQRGVYSCPQCRECFAPRPVLRRNYFIAEMLEKLKTTEGQSASRAGAGDVECDFCSKRKRKALKSCLTCLTSFCEDHLRPHYEVPPLKKHKLIQASKQLQEKICSKHEEVMKIYCRTDNSCVCYLCAMDEHIGHDTVSTAAERAGKQNQLKEIQKNIQRRIQEKQEELQELQQGMNTLKHCAQAAVEDSERIFNDLIRSIAKKRCEVTELIRDQEKTELSAAEELLEKLEQQISDLRRRNTDLEQLSHTEDHIHFLQRFQSHCVSPVSEDSSSITVHQHRSFDGMRRSLSQLKELLEEFCTEELSRITSLKAAQILPSEPKTREDFLQHFCQLTLDPSTVFPFLVLSENNREVMYTNEHQGYPDHPERFGWWAQVLSKESVSGRGYWEVECSGGYVKISVSYKEIGRKGRGEDCRFGFNSQSWSLRCSSPPAFCHNTTATELPGPVPSRIGVYVDHSAGILSFYGVSDTMTLLHTVHTTFTQPLYAGFSFGLGSVMKLCDKE